jgi:nicotinamidase-related amidase
LANTVRDIADGFQDQQAISKLVLLQDATSPVPGFEKMQDTFIADMSKKGMQVTKTTDFLV